MATGRTRPSSDDLAASEVDDVRSCKVKGCHVDLSQTKAYCIKKRLCPAHMRAEYVQQRGVPDQLFRFCFQCGKLEPLEFFEGDQRSCRERLELRRRPKRATSSSSDEGGGGGNKRSKGAAGQRKGQPSTAGAGTAARPRATLQAVLLQQQQASCAADDARHQHQHQQQQQQQLAWLQQQQQQQQQQPFGLFDAVTEESCGSLQLPADVSAQFSAVFGQQHAAPRRHPIHQQRHQQQFAGALLPLAPPPPMQMQMPTQMPSSECSALVRASAGLSAAGVASLLGCGAELAASAGAASAAPERDGSATTRVLQAAMRAQLAQLRAVCNQLRAGVGGGVNATPDRACAQLAPGGSSGLPLPPTPAPCAPLGGALLCTGALGPAMQQQQQQQQQHSAPQSALTHQQLVEQVVAGIDASAGAALAAQQLEAFLEQELQSAAGRAGAAPAPRATPFGGSSCAGGALPLLPHTPLPGRTPAALAAEIESTVSRCVSGASCLTGIAAQPPPQLAAQAPAGGCAFAGAARGARSQQGVSEGVPTSSGSVDGLDVQLLKLQSLQGHLMHLQTRIGVLRQHIDAAA